MMFPCLKECVQYAQGHHLVKQETQHAASRSCEAIAIACERDDLVIAASHPAKIASETDTSHHCEIAST
jgi:hypothetical protein